MQHTTTLSQPTVCAIVPAFNEARTIAAVTTSLRPLVTDVLVVDDGSTDGTADIARAAGAHVICHTRNRGKAMTLAHGMQHELARSADWVVTLDGDGQHPVHQLGAMLEIARQNPDNVVIGARMLSRASAPLLRRMANRLADFWVSWAAGTPYVDTQSGFRIYPATVATTLPPPSRPEHGFAYESELLITLGQQGVTVIHYPVETLYPVDRRASYYRAWRDTASIAAMVASRLLRRGMNPLALRRSLDPSRLHIATTEQRPANRDNAHVPTTGNH